MASVGVGTPQTPHTPATMLAGSQEDRLKRKKALESELEVIRQQKANVLRAIQQIAKKQKTGEPHPANLQASVELRKDAENRHHAESKRKVWSQCLKIINEILKNNSTRMYFGEPVHRDKYPGYYETIKNPRDLGTIKKQLEGQTHFKTVYEFRDDVRLCFENCRAFNPPGHQVRNIGDSASNSFEKKWETQQIESKWESEIQRHEKALKRLELEAKSLPEKIKEVDEELQALAAKAAEKTAPKPPGPDRPMTFEEKRKLSHAITQNLTGEHMARVLELIMMSPTAPKSDGEEELEIDIDTLDNDTLWKLHAYVDTVASEMANKQPPSSRPAAQQTVTATGETPTVDSQQEQVGEANAEGGASGSEGGGRAHDVTTFVSATGPGGAQPQIIKNTGQKKDVQIQDAKAWADLSRETTKQADGDVKATENDTLWTEFRGKEEEQKHLSEQKKALELEEEKKREEMQAAARKAEQEKKELAQQKANEDREKEEERRRREAAELEKMNTQAEEDAELDIMRQAGHENADHLNEMGLAARPEQNEASEDDAMDI